MHLAAYDDFAAGEAIHPNAIALYSDSQFACREAINATNTFLVPHRLDPQAQVDWTPVWSLTHQRFKYVMTAQAYFQLSRSTVRGSKPPYTFSDSNGCAAGSTLEDAVVQGVCELIERDAIAIWWYNRLRVRGVDLHSFDVPYLQAAEKFYHDTMGRSLWLLDLTSDLGVPAFTALSVNLTEGWQPTSYLWCGGAS